MSKPEVNHDFVEQDCWRLTHTRFVELKNKAITLLCEFPCVTRAFDRDIIIELIASFLYYIHVFSKYYTGLGDLESMS